MKIAIVTATFPPYHGGMGNVAYAHARELARQGEDVTVFCPKRSGERLVGENFKIDYLLPFLKYGNAAWVPQLVGELKGFDIVHLHYPFFGGAESVWLWARGKKNKEKRKLFVTYHMDVVGEGWLRWFFKLYRLIFLPRMLNAADKVFVSTQDYARNGDLAKYIEQDPEKFAVSNLGVDIENFSPGPKPEDLKNKYNLSDEDFVLLFVGGLDKPHYFKGLDYLLKAVAMLGSPGIKLLVVGGGELKEAYVEKAGKLGIEKRVNFCGPVSNRELAKFYRLCDLFVFPSIDKSEAYGLVALEAGACAKPTVASSLPGVRFVVKDNETGLLAEPKNADDLAEKIKILFNDHERGSKLGERARERVADEFTWPIIVKKIWEAYQGL